MKPAESAGKICKQRKARETRTSQSVIGLGFAEKDRFCSDWLKHVVTLVNAI